MRRLLTGLFYLSGGSLIVWMCVEPITLTATKTWAIVMVTLLMSTLITGWGSGKLHDNYKEKT
jgi:hypothetical protein